MRHTTSHFRSNATGYVALSLALALAMGGTAYAADRGEPRRDRDGHHQPRHGRPTPPSDEPGGDQGDRGDGGQHDGGQDGSGEPVIGLPGAGTGNGGGSNVAARARGSSAPANHGTSTDVPLEGGTWTQATGDLNLVAGAVTLRIPNNCTGGFGNALTLSVDGSPVTLALAPAPPFGKGTITVPFNIGTIVEPAQDSQHKLTAKFANSCSKDGEDYKIEDVKISILKFH